MAESNRALVREARFSDCERVVILQRRLGINVETEPETANRNWEGFWKRNPALTTSRATPPLGWVLEADNEIVGFFGSLPIRYQFGDRTLLAGIGTGWAVEKPFRTQTNDLAEAYFHQQEVDLLMGTSGIPAATRIYSRFSCSVIPQPDYDRVLFWAVTEAEVIRAALEKMNVPRRLAIASATALSPLLAGALALGGRRPGRLRAGIEPESIAIEDIGDEFDDLWRRKVAEGRRFYAYRSAEDLRWHFQSRNRPRAITMLRCSRDGRLDGYLVWERKEGDGLIVARILDLLVASNDARVIDALLAAAYETAREQRCHILELLGFPREVRARAAPRRLYSRPCAPICYKARSAELHSALLQKDAWYATRYDDDTSLA